MRKLLMEETIISKGIPLQLCDVFLPELNRSDSLDISYKHLSSVLEPFLHAVAHGRNKILINRIVEKVFAPLLENNVTESQSDTEEETPPSFDNGKFVDGGKLNPKTQREVLKLVDQKFVFPNFNILLYAQEHLFMAAASPLTREENRDLLYRLYDKAMKLEPEPEEKELTFSQRMLLNRAKAFITKKMERRMRVHQQKRSRKLLFKLGNMISSRLFSQQQMEEMRQEAEELRMGSKDALLHEFDEKHKIIDLVHQQLNPQKLEKLEGDLVMTVGKDKPKRKRNRKRTKAELGKKRVKFDLDQNKSRGKFLLFNRFRILHLWESGYLEAAREQSPGVAKQSSDQEV